MSDLDKDEEKAIIKQAFREAAEEWLDKQFMTFGKWTMAGAASAGLVALLFFILSANGWHK